jgi:hypothetical protein
MINCACSSPTCPYRKEKKETGRYFCDQRSVYLKVIALSWQSEAARFFHTHTRSFTQPKAADHDGDCNRNDSSLLLAARFALLYFVCNTHQYILSQTNNDPAHWHHTRYLHRTCNKLLLLLGGRLTAFASSCRLFPLMYVRMSLTPTTRACSTRYY